jgi:hypothetical protein
MRITDGWIEMDSFRPSQEQKNCQAFLAAINVGHIAPNAPTANSSPSKRHLSMAGLHSGNQAF